MYKVITKEEEERLMEFSNKMKDLIIKAPVVESKDAKDILNQIIEFIPDKGIEVAIKRREKWYEFYRSPKGIAYLERNRIEGYNRINIKTEGVSYEQRNRRDVGFSSLSS